MSEFKKNPVAVLHRANNRPVAMLNLGKPAFYLLGPQLFEAMMEELADHGLYQTVLTRGAEKPHAVEVDINEF